MRTVLAALVLSMVLGGCIINCSETVESGKGCKGCTSIVVVTSEGVPLPNAEVYLDGKFIGSPTGSSDHRISLDCGDHVVRITATGYKSYEKTVTILGRRNPQDLNVVLEKQ